MVFRHQRAPEKFVECLVLHAPMLLRGASPAFVAWYSRKKEDVARSRLRQKPGSRLEEREQGNVRSSLISQAGEFLWLNNSGRCCCVYDQSRTVPNHRSVKGQEFNALFPLEIEAFLPSAMPMDRPVS